MTVLLNNVDDDQVSAVISVNGGSFIANVRANDYGGATVELQVASKNDSISRFATLPGGTFTSNSTVKIDYLAVGLQLRAKLTGTTVPTDGVFVDVLQ